MFLSDIDKHKKSCPLTDSFKNDTDEQFIYVRQAGFETLPVNQ
jgi:hypothetical protein